MVDNSTNVTTKPDPTALVTQAIEKSETHQNEKSEVRFVYIEKQLDFQQRRIDERSNDISAAIVHLNALLISEIKKLEAVSEERFIRIDNQFSERDKRAEQLALAASTAIAAALQAQKEAVGEQNKSSALAIAKSESSTAENIRQLNTLFGSANVATNEKIDALTQRLDRGEGHSKGIGDFVGWIVGGIGFIATIVTIIGAVIALNR